MTRIGSLGSPYLNELLLELHVTLSSTDLRLSRGNECGLIALREGELIHASIAPRSESERPCSTGSVAVYGMLAWSSGTFAIVHTSEPVPKTVSTPLNDVLLEGIRRLADSADIRRRLPPYDTILDVVKAPRTVITTPLSAVELTVLAEIGSRHTLGEVLERSVLGVALCGQAILRLLTIGLVSVRLTANISRLLDCDPRTIFPLRQSLLRRMLVLLNPLVGTANTSDPIVTAVMERCTGELSAFDIARALAVSESQVLSVLDHLLSTQDVRVLRRS